MELAESLLVVPVPDVHVAVATARREGVVLTVIQNQSQSCHSPVFCLVPVLVTVLFLFCSYYFPILFQPSLFPVLFPVAIIILDLFFLHSVPLCTVPILSISIPILLLFFKRFFSCSSYIYYSYPVLVLTY